MANSERKKIQTGSRARIVARGTRVGWATGFSGGRDYTKDPQNVLGNIEVEEFATTGYAVSLQFSMIGLVGESLVKAGLLPQIGQSDEEHLRNVIAMEPFEVQIEDPASGEVTHEFYDMEIAGESFSLQSRSVLMSNVTLVGRRLATAGDL